MTDSIAPTTLPCPLLPCPFSSLSYCTRMRCVYFFLSLPGPLVLAVPRNSLLRFFLCLPVITKHVSTRSGMAHVRSIKTFLFEFPPWARDTTSGGVLTLLSAGLLDLVGLAVAHQSVVWFKLLDCLGGVVEEGKARALTATELRAEAEDGDLVLVGLVQTSELLAELVLGHVGAVRVQDVTGDEC